MPIGSMFPGERRLNVERRRRRSQLAGVFKFQRRRSLRRAQDRTRLMLLDHYPLPLMITAAVLLLLSLIDGVLTLVLVKHGAVELNPVMAPLIAAGPAYFMTGKYGLTVTALLIIIVLNQAVFGVLRIRVRSLLYFFITLFAMVVAWQIFLIVRFVI
jgi:hypothetical protein